MVKPVAVAVLKVVVEHVPKASLVNQRDKKNVPYAPTIGFNHKIYLKVKLATNVHVGGCKRTKVNRFATTPVASNPKIAATTNIGYRTNFPTKMNNPKPVVSIAQPVDHASVPLANRASVRCSGGRNAPT